jgi:subtilisin family serine protease
MRRFITSAPVTLAAALIVAFGVRATAELSALPAPPSTTATFPGIDKLDPLMQQAATDLSGQSRVIVRAADAASLPLVRTLIQQVGGSLGRQLPIIEAQVADVPNAVLPALAASAVISRIALDRATIATNERTAATVGAGQIRQTLGYDGTGVGIAVIDSGVAASHADLADGSGAPRIAQFIDFVNGAPAPYDDFGHGSHVAGILAGNGFDSAGRRAGIAPGARLLVLKVLDGAGRGRISDLIAALDYVIVYRNLFSIRVVNVSIGAGVYESCDTDLLTVAAKRVEEAGIVVVAAAGNNGRNGAVTQYGGVTAPGNAPWVLTVGASNHGGTVDRADDTMATFSSRGPTAVDDLAKPDVVAPGVGIESLSSPGSTLYGSRASGLLAGTIDPGYLPYLSLSGTSQATPVVSGSVALMLQANPALTPNAVKAILQYTAQTYPGYDALTQGSGFLNTAGAVALARYFGGQTAYPSDAGWSRQLIWGNHRIAGGYLLPTANAWSTDVQWGAAMAGPANAVWGVRPVYGLFGLAWVNWGTSCSNLLCTNITWGSPNSENVVWGSRCGGDDCHGGTIWSSPGSAMLMMWDASDGESETIVWGTSDGEGDTIVWGTTCDPNCHD